MPKNYDLWPIRINYDQRKTRYNQSSLTSGIDQRGQIKNSLRYNLKIIIALFGRPMVLQELLN